MDLLPLPSLTVLSDCVTIVEQDNVKIVRVIHDKAVAGIALHGGHVVSFRPTGQDDLLWMSKKAIFDGKTALRGGIPICWPWFGRLATPAHGFARSSQWQLIEHRENEQGVIVVLGLDSNQQTRSVWPHEFQLRLSIEISDSLTVRLTITNTDQKAWAFSGALHSYLNVADVRETTITGMGSDYIDSLQNDQWCQGEETLTLRDSIDRVYTKPQPHIQVQDHQRQRTLVVDNQGHNSAVLWNPWAQGAQSMGDMQDDGYLTMLCVESTWHAPSLTAGKVLQPGETHCLSTRITA
ncbi:D-hexose-6-phosphate mutarotase [Vibrio metschnikovii]|nr:D-hexose-6-phosphate mutarotase [Vibrio metschnikovii]